MPAVSQQGNVLTLWAGNPYANPNSGTATRVDASGDIVAASFVAASTSAVTDIDVNVKFTGDTSDVTFRVSIQGDSSNAPDGTPIGGTATFAGQNNTGQVWIGLQTLSGGGTGALTVGVQYWVVIDVSVAGSIDGTHYLEMYRDTSAYGWFGSRTALYTGSWTTNNGQNGVFVCKRADLSYTGFVYTAANQSHGSATDIYNDGTDHRQGLRFQAGCQVAVCGASVHFLKSGSPGTLTLTLYEGSTSRASVTRLAAEMVTNQWHDFWFGTPYLCAADTNLYLVFSNSAGSDANDYDIRGHTINTTYIECALPGTSWRFVYGSGTDPTAYTVDSSGFAAKIIPYIADPTVDLDQAAAGGGGGGGAGATNIWKALIDC